MAAIHPRGSGCLRLHANLRELDACTADSAEAAAIARYDALRERGPLNGHRKGASGRTNARPPVNPGAPALGVRLLSAVLVSLALSSARNLLRALMNPRRGSE